MQTLTDCTQSALYMLRQDDVNSESLIVTFKSKQNPPTIHLLREQKGKRPRNCNLRYAGVHSPRKTTSAHTLNPFQGDVYLRPFKATPAVRGDYRQPAGRVPNRWPWFTRKTLYPGPTHLLSQSDVRALNVALVDKLVPCAWLPSCATKEVQSYYCFPRQNLVNSAVNLVNSAAHRGKADEILHS